MNPDPQQFTDVTEHYDALMACVPYRRWVDYIEEILRRINCRPETILDIACGTGTVDEILTERGYKVTGVDIAPGMIEVAKRKTVMNCSAIPYYVQDAAELSVDGKFDLAISLFDSFNYILDASRLDQAINRIYEHLNQGGYLIFDINTEYALTHGFFNQSNICVYPKYVWNADYDRESRICSVNMVFEVLENGEKRQFTEIHRQKAYKIEDIDAMLMKAGFQIMGHYNAYKFSQPSRRSDRVFFVTRKR